MVKKQICNCNSWQVRNNSTNVAELLNPDFNFTKVPPRNLHFFSNDCYCRLKNISPQLFQKPKQCIFSENVEFRSDKATNINTTKSAQSPSKRIVTTCPKQNINQFNSYNKCTCANNAALTKTKVLHTLPANDCPNLTSYNNRESSNYIIQKKCSCNKVNCKTYTKSGTMGSTRSFQNTSYFSDLEKKESLEQLPSRSENQTESHDQIDFLSIHDHTKNQVNSEIDKHFYRDDVSENWTRKNIEKPSNIDNFKQIKDFRNDHYFETHSTEDLIKSVPEHTCIHKFELDERFFPRPLYTDSYNTSRCTICNKPMEQIERENFRNETNLFPHYYKHGFAPKKVYIGNGINVHISADDYVSEEVDEIKHKNQINYFNTYALKYQKLAV